MFNERREYKTPHEPGIGGNSFVTNLKVVCKSFRPLTPTTPLLLSIRSSIDIVRLRVRSDAVRCACAKVVAGAASAVVGTRRNSDPGKLGKP